MDFKVLIFVLVAVVAAVAGVVDYVGETRPSFMSGFGDGISGFFDNPTGFVTGFYKEDPPKTVDFRANLTFSAPVSINFDFKEPLQAAAITYTNMDNVFYINGLSVSSVETTLFEARDFNGKVIIAGDVSLSGKATQLRLDKSFIGNSEEEIKVVAENISYDSLELMGVPQITVTLPTSSGTMMIYNTGDTVAYNIANKEIEFITFTGDMKFIRNTLEISGIGTIKTSTLTTTIE